MKQLHVDYCHTKSWGAQAMPSRSVNREERAMGSGPGMSGDSCTLRAMRSWEESFPEIQGPGKGTRSQLSLMCHWDSIRSFNSVELRQGIEEGSSQGAKASSWNCGACTEINLEITLGSCGIEVARVRLSQKVKVPKAQTQEINSVEICLSSQNTRLLIQTLPLTSCVLLVKLLDLSCLALCHWEEIMCPPHGGRQHVSLCSEESWFMLLSRHSTHLVTCFTLQSTQVWPINFIITPLIGWFLWRLKKGFHQCLMSRKCCVIICHLCFIQFWKQLTMDWCWLLRKLIHQQYVEYVWERIQCFIFKLRTLTPDPNTIISWSFREWKVEAESSLVYEGPSQPSRFIILPFSFI